MRRARTSGRDPGLSPSQPSQDHPIRHLRPQLDHPSRPRAHEIQRGGSCKGRTDASLGTGPGEIESIGILAANMFEPSDAFRLIGAIGSVSDAEKVVAAAGGYETNDGGECKMNSRGPVVEARPISGSLEPQLRAATSKTVRASFTLTFCEGLRMEGDAPAPPANRLGRFASVSAHVPRAPQSKL